MRIKDNFKILHSKKAVGRECSIIDWVQEGIVAVEDCGELKKEWREKYGEKYAGICSGLSNYQVMFSDRHIIQ